MSKLSMLVCTWNVGNAEPPLDLSAWLGGGGNREYDIIVVGAQEANFSVAENLRADGEGEPLAPFSPSLPMNAPVRAPKNVSAVSSPTTPPRRLSLVGPSSPKKTASLRGALNVALPPSAVPSQADAVTSDAFRSTPSTASPELPLTPSRRGVAAATAAAAAVTGAATAAVAAGLGVGGAIGVAVTKNQPPARAPSSAQPSPPPRPASPEPAPAAVEAIPEKRRFTRRLLRVLTTANLRHRSSVPGSSQPQGSKMRSSKSLGAGIGIRRQNRRAANPQGALPCAPNSGASPPSSRHPVMMRHGTSLMDIGSARFTRTSSPDVSTFAFPAGNADHAWSRAGRDSSQARGEPSRGAVDAAFDDAEPHKSSSSVSSGSGGKRASRLSGSGGGRGADGSASARLMLLRGRPEPDVGSPSTAKVTPPALLLANSPGKRSLSPCFSPVVRAVTFSSSSDESFASAGVEDDLKVTLRQRPAATARASRSTFVDGTSLSTMGVSRIRSEKTLNVRPGDLDLDVDDDELGAPRPAGRASTADMDGQGTVDGYASENALAELNQDDADDDDFGTDTVSGDDDDDVSVGRDRLQHERSLEEPSESDEDDTFDLYNVDNRRSLVVDATAAANLRHKFGSKKQSKRRRVLRKTSDDALGNRFNSRVAACVGDEYVAVARQHLMEIKLQVFVHRRIKDRVLKTKTVTEATGLGHVVGNKGAVAVKITIDDTTLCFVSSHLAAHEGAKFLRERNAQAQEILRSIDRVVPALHSFDHVFWMGDLNYRLDVSRVVPEAAEWQHARKWKWVRRRIASGNYADLLKADELIGEMQSNNCVFGRFVEGPLEFLPTFKVHRHAEDDLTDAVAQSTAPGASASAVTAASTAVMSMYQKERVPSYCDRVLWHSLPVHRKHAVLLEYSAVPSINTSDHKPVYAVFELVVPRPLTKYPLPPPLSSIKCTIDVRRLRLTDSVARSAGSGGYAAELRAGFDPAVMTQQNEFLDDVVRADGAGYSPMDEGGKGGRAGDSGISGAVGVSDIHSRRPVKVEFLGPSLLLKGRSYSSVVPLRDAKRGGKVRECVASELPCLPCVPVLSLAELQYKYLTIVFSRSGSKGNSSCVLPVSSLIHAPGHKLRTSLELLKHGRAIGTVEVEAEFAISCEWWISSDNRKIVNRRGRPRG